VGSQKQRILYADAEARAKLGQGRHSSRPIQIWRNQGPPNVPRKRSSLEVKRETDLPIPEKNKVLSMDEGQFITAEHGYPKMLIAIVSVVNLVSHSQRGE